MPAGLVGRRQTSLGRRGMSGFIVSLIPDTSGIIPDTSGIHGLAQFIPKCSLSSNPLFCYFLVQKVYNLDPNRVSSLSLSNAMK